MERRASPHWLSDGTGVGGATVEGCPAGVVALHDDCCRPPLLQAAPPGIVAVTVLAVLGTVVLPAAAEI